MKGVAENAAGQAKMAAEKAEEAAEQAKKAEAKGDKEAAEQARIEVEKAKEAADQARIEAEKAKEVETKQAEEAEAKGDKEAAEQARKEAEKAKEAAGQARIEAERAKETAEKARIKAEEEAKREAEEKAKREAEEKAKREAEEEARREAEEHAKEHKAEVKPKEEKNMELEGQKDAKIIGELSENRHNLREHDSSVEDREARKKARDEEEARDEKERRAEIEARKRETEELIKNQNIKAEKEKKRIGELDANFRSLAEKVDEALDILSDKQKSKLFQPIDKEYVLNEEGYHYCKKFIKEYESIGRLRNFENCFTVLINNFVSYMLAVDGHCFYEIIPIEVEFEKYESEVKAVEINDENEDDCKSKFMELINSTKGTINKLLATIDEIEKKENEKARIKAEEKEKRDKELAEIREKFKPLNDKWSNLMDKIDKLFKYVLDNSEWVLKDGCKSKFEENVKKFGSNKKEYHEFMEIENFEYPFYFCVYSPMNWSHYLNKSMKEVLKNFLGDLIGYRNDSEEITNVEGACELIENATNLIESISNTIEDNKDAILEEQKAEKEKEEEKEKELFNQVREQYKESVAKFSQFFDVKWCNELSEDDYKKGLKKCRDFSDFNNLEELQSNLDWMYDRIAEKFPEIGGGFNFQFFKTHRDLNYLKLEHMSTVLEYFYNGLLELEKKDKTAGEKDKEEEEAKREAEEQVRKEQEEKARREAEEQARKEQEEKARREAEEQARKEQKEQSKKVEEKKVKKVGEEKTKHKISKKRNEKEKINDKPAVQVAAERNKIPEEPVADDKKIKIEEYKFDWEEIKKILSRDLRKSYKEPVKKWSTIENRINEDKNMNSIILKKSGEPDDIVRISGIMMEVIETRGKTENNNDYYNRFVNLYNSMNSNLKQFVELDKKEKNVRKEIWEEIEKDLTSQMNIVERLLVRTKSENTTKTLNENEKTLGKRSSIGKWFNKKGESLGETMAAYVTKKVSKLTLDNTLVNEFANMALGINALCDRGLFKDLRSVFKISFRDRKNSYGTWYDYVYDIVCDIDKGIKSIKVKKEDKDKNENKYKNKYAKQAIQISLMYVFLRGMMHTKAENVNSIREGIKKFIAAIDGNISSKSNEKELENKSEVVKAGSATRVLCKEVKSNLIEILNREKHLKNVLDKEKCKKILEFIPESYRKTLKSKIVK